MKKYIFIIIIISFVKTTFAQKNILSSLPKQGNSIEAFIPKDYDTLATASGDLNKDGLIDMALVLANKNESLNDDKDNEHPRLLIIIFKKENGYQLAATSYKSIMCMGCGGVFGDPFESLSIENNILTIRHYGGSAWRWGYTHQFKFQNHAFYLISREYNSYWNGSYCDKLEEFTDFDCKKENFLTGSYMHKQISHDCKLLENTKKKIAIKPLQKLSTFDIYKM